jgi:hypothetical protein
MYIPELPSAKETTRILLALILVGAIVGSLLTALIIWICS